LKHLLNYKSIYHGGIDDQYQNGLSPNSAGEELVEKAISQAESIGTLPLMILKGSDVCIEIC
jgi:hypothetical protein